MRVCYLEDHVEIVIFSNHFFQLDDICMANLLQSLIKKNRVRRNAHSRSSRLDLLSLRVGPYILAKSLNKRRLAPIEDLLFPPLTIFLFHSKEKRKMKSQRSPKISRYRLMATFSCGESFN